MPNCRKTIYSRMDSLNLYRFPKNKMTLVQSEIESYLSVLEFVEQKIAEIKQDIFAGTCGEKRLTEFERMLGIPVNLEIPVEQRKKILTCKMSLGPSDFNKDGLERSLKALGIEAAVREEPAGSTIWVDAPKMADSKMTLDEAKKVFQELMPAHLEAEFLTGGIDFCQFDALDKTFAQLDRMDKSWSQLELMTADEWKKGE